MKYSNNVVNSAQSFLIYNSILSMHSSSTEALPLTLLLANTSAITQPPSSPSPSIENQIAWLFTSPQGFFLCAFGLILTGLNSYLLLITIKNTPMMLYNWWNGINSYEHDDSVDEHLQVQPIIFHNQAQISTRPFKQWIDQILIGEHPVQNPPTSHINDKLDHFNHFQCPISSNLLIQPMVIAHNVGPNNIFFSETSNFESIMTYMKTTSSMKSPFCNINLTRIVLDRTLQQVIQHLSMLDHPPTSYSQFDHQTLSLLKCPLTDNLMITPVIAADGFSYELTAMVEYLAHGNNMSPVTQQPLIDKILMRNQLLEHILSTHKTETNAMQPSESSLSVQISDSIYSALRIVGTFMPDRLKNIVDPTPLLIDQPTINS